MKVLSSFQGLRPNENGLCRLTQFGDNSHPIGDKTRTIDGKNLLVDAGAGLGGQRARLRLGNVFTSPFAAILILHSA